MKTDLPTSEELWVLMEDVEPVSESVDPDDYMNIITAVFQLEDGRYVEITYEADGQGDYNTWRDETGLEVTEVFPHQVVTTVYKKVRPEPEQLGALRAQLERETSG